MFEKILLRRPLDLLEAAGQEAERSVIAAELTEGYNRLSQSPVFPIGIRLQYDQRADAWAPLALLHLVKASMILNLHAEREGRAQGIVNKQGKSAS